MNYQLPRLSRRTIIRVLVLVAMAVSAYYAKRSETRDAPAAGDESEILAAFDQKRSDLWVEADGTVTKTLPDDNEGSRHQRFILSLPSGHTILISHNIDLSHRVDDLEAGDRVGFRGEYEWNAQGGVVHWTHRDPRGRIPGGWLEHRGRRYD